MTGALVFILVILLMIGFVVRAIWVDAKRAALRNEPTEHGVDDEADALPFRRIGPVAADVVEKLDRRRA